MRTSPIFSEEFQVALYFFLLKTQPLKCIIIFPENHYDPSRALSNFNSHLCEIVSWESNSKTSFARESKAGSVTRQL